MNTVVVDIQIGDCGKGKIADHLMKEHDICVRYSGGPNTGTTVCIDKNKYKLHHLPVGLLHNKPSYIAPTVLINAQKLLKEISNLQQQGFDLDNTLKISPNCHVITDLHIESDIKKEVSGKGIGSTKQGISPCSVDKYNRTGLRLFECKEAVLLEKHFVDVSYELNKAIRNNKNILFQSSQGTLLDIDHGNYPYVSTTSNTAGAAAMACGIGPQYINRVVGVFKAYLTYVGNGNFVTEIKDQIINDYIVEKGYEFGTTTGRRRRVGWIDLPMLSYAANVNGCTELAITKFDVLSEIDKQACISYNHNGKEIYYPPMIRKNLENCIPNYIQHNSGDCFDLFADIVESCFENDIRIKYVSTGPGREQIITKK